jgi:hypothetical protein
MTGSDNVGFYMAQDPDKRSGGAVMINNGNISGTAGNNNVGIYNYGGTVDNYGTVAVGNSDIEFITGNNRCRCGKLVNIQWEYTEKMLQL